MTFLSYLGQSVIALETKVTSVVGHALNDVSTAQGAVRIIHLLGSFLQRPLIQKKVLESHNRLGKSFYFYILLTKGKG